MHKVHATIERPPADLKGDIGALGQGLFQPALADEAPGADDVGDDFDAHA